MYNQETDKILTATIANPNPSTLYRTSTSQLFCRCLHKIDTKWLSALRDVIITTFWDEKFSGHVSIMARFHSHSIFSTTFPLLATVLTVYKYGNNWKPFLNSIRIFLSITIYHSSRKALATFQHCQTLCPSRGIRSSNSSWYSISLEAITSHSAKPDPFLYPLDLSLHKHGPPGLLVPIQDSRVPDDHSGSISWCDIISSFTLWPPVAETSPSLAQEPRVKLHHAKAKQTDAISHSHHHRAPMRRSEMRGFEFQS